MESSNEIEIIHSMIKFEDSMYVAYEKGTPIAKAATVHKCAVKLAKYIKGQS
jgi:hypothetical protein